MKAIHGCVIYGKKWQTLGYIDDRAPGIAASVPLSARVGIHVHLVPDYRELVPR